MGQVVFEELGKGPIVSQQLIIGSHLGHPPVSYDNDLIHHG